MSQSTQPQFECPNCGAALHNATLISRGDPELVDDGVFEWPEKYLCNMCDTEYTIKNSNQ